MKVKVVAAQQVADSPEDLAAWLEERAAEGWVLVAVDSGVLYLRNDQEGVIR